jgi:hypothetical protein
MRTLQRNKTRIFYANYRGKIPLKDEYGNLTGEYKISYGNPIEIMANVSAGSGDATTQLFGEHVSYDRTIILGFPAPPISETSILWVDRPPKLADDGSTKTPHDYIVKRVAPGLNSVSIAVSGVSVTQFPQDDDSYVELQSDRDGNVLILSSNFDVHDDGAGNVALVTR